MVEQAPGADWRYSSGGYTVLQVLMEDVTGKPFARLMDDLVLKPIGMANSVFGQPLKSPYLARAAYAFDKAGRIRPTHTYPTLAASGLWTTPTDLIKLMENLHKSYHLGEGLISKKSA